MIDLDIELTMIPRLGCKGIHHLREIFGTAEDIFNTSPEEFKQQINLSTDIIKHITKRSARGAAKAEMEYCKRHDIMPIAVGDRLYPPLLAEVEDAPHVIYAMGNIEALNSRTLSIVGTRRMTHYGERVTTQVIKDLAPRVADLAIVSGLAFGIDAAAHRAAIDRGIKSIAVLANPLPDITPVQHTNFARDMLSKGATIISELHSQTKMNGRYYIPRNRIIAAMSSVTLVTESTIEGGAMSTAKMAFDYSREVLAVPGRVTDIYSAGCNMLIRNEIAKSFLSSEDIIRSAMWDIDTHVAPPVSKAIDTSLFSREQLGLFNYINHCEEPPTINHLLEITALDHGTLSMLLMELEFLGAIKLLSGQRYAPFMRVNN